MKNNINRFLAYYIYFFFNDTATTEIYTLSLHDALPISSIIDALYDTFGTAVELSEEVVDTIIDAHNNRINLTVEFQKKFLETIKVQRLTNKVDFDEQIGRAHV